MKYTALRNTVRIISMLILGTLNLILSMVYLLLPVGIYMMLLQFREKVSKVSALSTFTEDDSTWQFIHPNFILVCKDPKEHKVAFKKFIKAVNNFYNNYKSLIILGSIFITLVLLYIGLIVKN